NEKAATCDAERLPCDAGGGGVRLDRRLHSGRETDRDLPGPARGSKPLCRGRGAGMNALAALASYLPLPSAERSNLRDPRIERRNHRKSVQQNDPLASAGCTGAILCRSDSSYSPY